MNKTRQEEALRSQKGALTHHCWPSETAAVLDSFYWSLVITIWALSSCHPIWTKWKEVVQLVRWIREWMKSQARLPPSQQYNSLWTKGCITHKFCFPHSRFYDQVIFPKKAAAYRCNQSLGSFMCKESICQTFPSYLPLDVSENQQNPA